MAPPKSTTSNDMKLAVNVELRNNSMVGASYMEVVKTLDGRSCIRQSPYLIEMPMLLCRFYEIHMSTALVEMSMSHDMITKTMPHVT